MNKRLSIIILMISSFFSHGQHINFQENVNYKANELQQLLNKNGDTLLLESKKNHILQVDIFNNNYSKSYNVKSTKTKINLNSLPLGNYIVQAKLNKKLIIMYLQKNEDIKISNISQKAENAKVKQKTHDDKLDKNSDYYWVVYESNSNFGSSKSMKLEYKKDIDKLISKNKLELKSNVGKDNKLVIYAIYDKSMFMTQQLRDPIYYKTEKSEFFNTKPFYASNMDNHHNATP